jgi:protein-disulfide isomerase
LKQLTKSQNPALKGRVKLVFKHFPLGFHKQAMNAAKASIAAHRQGKFWEMHDVIFKNQKTLADDSYEKFAKEIGLKVAKFKKDFADPATDAEVKQDMSEARAAGVNGTPNVYINGRKYQGGYSEKQIGGIVSKYLK